MAAPKPGATAPPRNTVTTAGAMNGPQLSSSAFRAGGALPAAYLCDADAPPPLAWTTPPKSTKEIVLVMFALRPEADVHWFVTGIDPTLTSFTGTVPPGATVRTNSFGTDGYTAPCPDDGVIQNFQFEILTLTAPARITEGQTPTGVLQQLEAQAGNGRGFLTTNNVGGQPGPAALGTTPPGSTPLGTAPIGTTPLGSAPSSTAPPGTGEGEGVTPSVTSSEG